MFRSIFLQSFEKLSYRLIKVVSNRHLFTCILFTCLHIFIKYNFFAMAIFETYKMY
jgi:hypothetical protein